MKAVIRILQVMLTVIWLGLLALSAVLFMSAREGGLAGISDWRGYVVPDGRMAPELSAGDLAVIRMGAVPQAGDAVLCPDGTGKLELTRIIGTSEGQLILKPDGTDDSRLAAAEEIEGVLWGYLPGFGEPFGLLCSLTGVIVILAAGLLLVILPGFLLRAPAPSKPKKQTRPPRQGGYTPRH